MSSRVFVYGTLLKGEGNHRLLELSQLIGAASTRPKFSFHDLGGCPGLVWVSSSAVRYHAERFAAKLTPQAVTGEVYEVTAATLRDLDRLEGHPTFYRRTTIELADGSYAMTYILPPQYADRPVITSGCWRTHKKAHDAHHHVRRSRV